MKRKILSLALALAMCLSLTIPALAEDTNDALIAEGRQAIQVDYEGTEVPGELTLYEGSVYNDYISENRVGGYNLLPDGATITVTNAGTNTSAYIYVYYQKYELQTESKVVDDIDMQGKYYGGFWDYYLSPKAPTSSAEETISAGSGRYWRGIEEVNDYLVDITSDAVCLYKGETTTFVLPESNENTIYLLYALCYFPEEDYTVWKYFPMKYGEVSDTPDTPELPSFYIEPLDKLREGQTYVDFKITAYGIGFTSSQSMDNWSISSASGLELVNVRTSKSGDVILSLSGKAQPGEMTITAKPAAFEPYDPDFVLEHNLTCTVTIEKVEIITFTPQVTATPTTAAAGDTTVVVTLDTANGSFSYGRLHDAMGAGIEKFFSIDAGTTGLVLTAVEAVQPDLTRAYYQAKLTFTASGGAQAGTLRITPLAFSFERNNADPTDANTVTVTVSGGSNPVTPDPDIPYIPSTPSGGSGTTTRPSTSTTTTPSTNTVTNPDGSTTTTKTDKSTGTVTETTKAPDGSETVVETKTDGTVTTTTTDAVGNMTAITENPNGSTVTTVENKDGGTSITTVSASGQVTAVVTVPSAAVTAAQSSSQAVVLPMPEVPLMVNTAAAPVVTVTTGSNQPVKVEIPVERTTPGTVAVIVNADGTEEVVKTSLATANGVTLTVANGVTVKVVDNSKSFTDTAAHWADNAITFATAHELFNGTGADRFTPDGTMTRGMMVTVLARYDGVDTSTGATWYEKGVDWAAVNSISSGADLDAPVSREQLATMLYRYAAASGLSTTASGSLTGFADVDSISSYATDAMAWAVGAGLFGGTDKGELNPGGSATRAEVATILMRFCENVVK